MSINKPIELISNETLWQDRELRFDSIYKDLKLRNGEKIIEYFDKVEDSKGNSGDEGRFSITDLRIIWQSKVKPRINLTIGFNCILSVAIRNFHNRVKGKYNALHIMSKYNGTRYEFIFTQFKADGITPVDFSIEKNNRLLSCVTKVFKAYFCTKLFRDLKLRSAIFSAQGKQLKLLPSEQIYSKFEGVWNLSSDQGNLGTMHVTNFRIVWHANVNEFFNLSLPYIQIYCIRVRESKFGPALVIESTEISGGYILGFRIDPFQRLKTIYSQLANLFNVHVANPSFGVEAYLGLGLDNYKNDKSSNLQDLENFLMDEQDYLDESKDSNSDVIASYLADDSEPINKDDAVVYCSELGLAIEKIKPGYTLESLWNVISSK